MISAIEETLIDISKNDVRPIKQFILEAHVPKDARSLFVTINGLIFHGLGIMGTLDILSGSILPSFSMSIVYFLIDIVGVFLFMKGVQ